METLSTILTILAFVLSGAVVALAGVAPLTKTEADNKILAFLQKGLGYLEALIRALFPKRLLPAKP